MKAITLYQPWASAITVGVKRFETRGYRCPSLIGQPVAIHASVADDESGIERWTMNVEHPDYPENRAAFVKHGFHEWSDLPKGKVIALAHVIRCVDVRELVRTPDAIRVGELMWGDYSPGRFAWELRLFYTFEDPILARGNQGIWNWHIPDEWMKKAADNAGIPGLFDIWKAVNNKVSQPGEHHSRKESQ